MGIVADVTNLILQAYKIWQERDSLRTVSPQELHDKYIAPSYVLLKQIHNDYVEMYAELEERIYMDEEKVLSRATVEWFTRARLRHQADRSELRLMAVPLAKPSNNWQSDNVNDAAATYIHTVRSYFHGLEDNAGSSAFEDVARHIPSPSSETERRLRVMLYWLSLSPHDRSVFATDDYLSQIVQSEDSRIERILSAAAGDMEESASQRLDALYAEASEAAKSEEGAQWNRRTSEVHSVEGDYSTRWQNVVLTHVFRQSHRFQGAIGYVQLAYVRFRILADR